MQERPVALVTGASRGIGRATAIALAKAGHDVVITARATSETNDRGVEAGLVTDADSPIRGRPGLEATAAEVEAAGSVAHIVCMDLTDPDSVSALVPRALSVARRVDVLVNNAIYQGSGPMKRILDLTLHEAEIIVRADYLHQLELVQRVLPHMLERGTGTIVTMSSGSAHLDPPAPAGMGGWGVAYAAAKAAVTRIAPVVHAEYASDGICCFNVDPGFVIGERMRSSGDDRQFVEAGFRGAAPEVPAAAIAWLATDPAARELAGSMVFAQRLVKDLGLVPGWPAPGSGRSHS